MDRMLERYIREFSSPEDPLLEELYRQTHIRFVNPNMVTGHQQGKLLEFLSCMIKPSAILEIGTFTGYSAICLARGLKPGGKLITVDIDDEMTEFAMSYFKKAGMSGIIHQLCGRAQDLVPRLDEEFELAYIDGDKREYCEYFMAVREKVTKGGFIIADNVLWGGKVTDNGTTDQQTRGVIEFNELVKSDPGFENIILPLRDGMMIIRKL